MTPQERVEKLSKFFDWGEHSKALIVAEIERAVEEEKAKWIRIHESAEATVPA